MFQDLLTELRQCAPRLPLNILILGIVTHEQRAQALQQLRGGCERDAHHPQRRMGFELPTVSTSTIVVIDEVAGLSTDEQQTLLQWLEQHRDTMVLSFGTHAVFPLVTQGQFVEKLYYRLNVMTLNINDDAAVPPGDHYPRAATKTPFRGSAL